MRDGRPRGKVVTCRGGVTHERGGSGYSQMGWGHLTDTGMRRRMRKKKNIGDTTLST
jgi:hypothetical protein